MSGEHIVGLAGLVVVLAGLTACALILRSGSILPPPRPPDPLCGGCLHGRSEHWKASGRCVHEDGDPREGNDSYGSGPWTWSKPPVCACPAFRPRTQAS
ncbi:MULTISPECIES: hypothetical protein [Streptomyces]|uniref:Uncharacterized protein n=1 Tax=Streptomyces xanthii TaxID=2768069 RepID=A0A7H1BH06_9ACTN|nr:hypothetical protein [Streptomyces xanthii]QNS08011.1 hypothetical protein IAG42_33305 [Streptomyces xanthii]